MSDDVKTQIWAIKDISDIHIDPQIMQMKLQARCNPKGFEEIIYDLFPGSVKMDGSTAWMSIKGALHGEDYDNIMNSLAALEGNTNVERLVLDISSPGGEVTGCGEAAEAIASFSKPVYTIASGVMCSAAYWIGSQADEVAASDSCSVGSVGVIATHMSLKGAYDKMGIKVTEVARGEKKNLFSPNKDLSDKGMTELQSQVNLFFNKFADAVKSKRDSLSDKVFDSGVFHGQDAVEAGLIDGVINNKNTMSGLFKSKESPPIAQAEGDQAVTKSEWAESMKAMQDSVSALANSLEPVVADYKRRAEMDKEKEEEKEAIAAINKKRAARGESPLVVKEDDYEDKDKKEAPGRHEKKSEKENPFEKKDEKDDKDAKSLEDRLAARIDGKLNGILKGLQQAGVGVDPLAVDAEDNGHVSREQLATGKTIPVEKSWKWALTTAPAIRGSLIRSGDLDSANELDSVVSKIKMELRKNGLEEPKNIDSLIH